MQALNPVGFTIRNVVRVLFPQPLETPIAVEPQPSKVILKDVVNQVLKKPLPGRDKEKGAQLKSYQAIFGGKPNVTLTVGQRGRRYVGRKAIGSRIRFGAFLSEPAHSSFRPDPCIAARIVQYSQ